MAKIIISILTFLLMLFPNWSGLLAEYQFRTFDMDTSVSMVMDAISAKDIGTIETMMCLNIKQNILDLPDEIGKLINAIDGSIVEISPWRRNYSSTTANGRERLYFEQIKLDFKTSEKEYSLGIMWGIVNSLAPKEIGIRRIVLTDPSLFGTDGYVVATIHATEYD